MGWTNAAVPGMTEVTWEDRPATPAQVAREATIQTLRRVFQRADRVLIGEKVNVEIASSGPAPAWSDGQTITLNQGEITDTDLAALIQIHGLNYHEVCHVLYTPRKNSALTQWVLDRNFFPAYNMLEDQRIETLLVGRYPSVAPYLSATVLRWLADTPEKVSSNYILVRGRRYLPLEVRVAFRRAFADREVIDAACKIIDQYRLLVFPRDYEQAKVLIEAFTTQVLRQMGGDPTPPCKGASTTTGGRPQGQNEQDKDSKKAKAQSAQSEDEADEDEADKPQSGEGEDAPESDSDDEGQGAQGDEDGEDEGQGAGGSDDSEGEGAEPGSGKGEGSEGEGEGDAQGGTNEGGNGSESDQSGESDSPIDGEGGNGAGGAHDGPVDIAQVLSKALEAIESDQSVVAEMEGKQRVINKGDGEYESKVPLTQAHEEALDPATKSSQRKFQEVLRTLVEDCEPGWERETPSGRLNVQRVMQGCDMDEAFDRWAEGSEGSDLEVVGLYDNSGSMRDREGYRNATRCAYIIQRSVKAVGGDCTSLVFGHGVGTLYSNNEKVSTLAMKQTGARGGTYAHLGLEEAERILRASKRKNRLLLIVTDGEWEYSEQCDDILRRIEALGAHTALAFVDTSNVGTENAERFRHGAQVFGAIANPADLPAWGKAVVAHAVKRGGAAR